MRALKRSSALALAAIVILYALMCSGKKRQEPPNQAITDARGVSEVPERTEVPGAGPAESVPAGGDWEDAFAFVRDAIRTDASRFPIKTAEGVRLGQSGNALEKALLLAQILQDNGATVQVVEGDLGDAEAKNLLGSIFPAAKAFSYDADVQVSVPAGDSSLISAVNRHFWVQVETEDKWLDLDPSFPGAKPGQAFAPLKETYDPADKSLKTRVSIALECEIGDSAEPKSVLSWNGGMEEVANQPLSLSIVTEFQAADQKEEKEEGEAAGGVFGALGGKTSKSKKTKGEPETVYNAALTVRGKRIADGQILPGKETVCRFTLKIKFEGLEEVISESERPLFEKTDDESAPPLFQRHSILVTGNRIPPGAWEDKLKAVSDNGLLGEVKAGVEEVKKKLKSKKFDRSTLEKSAELEATLGPELGHLVNMIFASTSDDLAKQQEEALSVHSFYRIPRILITSFAGDQEKSKVILDLRQDRVEAYPFPGQAMAMAGTFLYGRGIMESTLEGQLLELLSGKQALTTAVLMQEAAQRDIPIRMFSSLEKQNLRNVDLPTPVAEKVGTALDSGRIVVLPEKGVPWEGEIRWGWWDVDPQTMETVGVMDTGLHQAMVQRTILETEGPLQTKMGFVIGAMVGAVDTQWMIAGMILKYGELNKAALLEAKAYMKNINAYMCPGFEKKISVGVGFTAAEMEDCFKLGVEIKAEAGVEIKQGWCENFAKGFACASTTILNYYLSQFEE